jgi:PRC-barrel domain
MTHEDGLWYKSDGTKSPGGVYRIGGHTRRQPVAATTFLYWNSMVTEPTGLSDPHYFGSIRLVTTALQQRLAAYGRDNSKLGTVEQFIVDMFTGHAKYAVLSFGGFLGLGQKYHPIPFKYLRVSTDGAGYVLDIDKSLIDGSPSYRRDDAPVFDQAYGERILSYYAGTDAGGGAP